MPAPLPYDPFSPASVVAHRDAQEAEAAARQAAAEALIPPEIKAKDLRLEQFAAQGGTEGAIAHSVLGLRRLPSAERRMLAARLRTEMPEVWGDIKSAAISYNDPDLADAVTMADAVPAPAPAPLDAMSQALVDMGKKAAMRRSLAELSTSQNAKLERGYQGARRKAMADAEAELVERMPVGTQAITAGLRQAGLDLGGLGIRLADTVGLLPDDSGGADQFVRDAGSITQGGTQNQGEFGRHLAGTVRSLSQMAATGGSWGSILSAATVEGNQALTEGRDAGMSGLGLAGYVGAQGVMEALPAAVMQKVGLGGMEDVFKPGLRNLFINGLRDGVTRATGRVVSNQMLELPEEIVTEVGHAVISKLSGVDPNALTPENLQKLITDTTIQTLMMGGGAGAVRTGADAVNLGRESLALNREIGQGAESLNRDVLRAALADAGRTPEQAAASAQGPGPVQVTPEQATAAEDRDSFQTFLGQAKRTPEEYRAGSENTDDVVPQPAGEPVAVGPSAIEGKGILAQAPATAGQAFATALTPEGKRTQVGRYLNHSARPNARLEQQADGSVAVVPQANLAAGEELTVNYRQAHAVMEAQRQVIDQKAAPAAPVPAGKIKAPPKTQGKGLPEAAPEGDWVAFEEPEAIGIPRSSMPQVSGADRPALMEYLKGRGIRVNTETVDPNTLKPTQAEYAPSKVAAARQEAAAALAAGKPVRPVIVANDGHVVDGHHQWLAAKESGEQVPVIRLNVPIAQALKEVRLFQRTAKYGGADGRAAPANQRTTTTTTPTPKAPDAPAPVAPAAVAGEQPAPAQARTPVASDQTEAKPVMSDETAPGTKQEPAEPPAAYDAVDGEGSAQAPNPGPQSTPLGRVMAAPTDPVQLANLTSEARTQLLADALMLSHVAKPKSKTANKAKVIAKHLERIATAEAEASAQATAVQEAATKNAQENVEKPAAEQAQETEQEPAQKAKPEQKPESPSPQAAPLEEELATVAMRMRQNADINLDPLARSIKSLMPGAPRAMLIPDGPFGLMIRSLSGNVIRVRMATPQDLDRQSQRLGERIDATNVNGWAEGNTIYLVPGGATRHTYNHEFVHVLENAGVLAKAEVDRLYKIAMARMSKAQLADIEAAYTDAYGNPMDQATRVREYAAHVVEMSAAGEITPPRFVQRALDWLRDVAALLRVMSQSDSTLLRSVVSGEVIERKPADQGMGLDTAMARPFPPPRGEMTGRPNWTLRNGVQAMQVIRKISGIPSSIAKKMGLSKPADVVLQSGRHDPLSGGGFGLLHLEEAEKRKHTLRDLGLTIDQFLDRAAQTLPESTIYKQGERDFVVVTPITDSAGRKHKVVLMLRADGDQLGVHSIGRVEHGETVRGMVVWSGEAIPPNGTRSAIPPLSSVPQKTAGDDTRPGADTAGIVRSDERESNPRLSRRRGSDTTMENGGGTRQSTLEPSSVKRISQASVAMAKLLELTPEQRTQLAVDARTMMAVVAAGSRMHNKATALAKNLERIAQAEVSAREAVAATERSTRETGEPTLPPSPLPEQPDTMPTPDAVAESARVALLQSPWEQVSSVYRAHPESRGGREINADVFRDLVPAYNQSGATMARYAGATHEAVKVATERYWQDMLARTDLPGRNAVVFLAGGAASGKGSAMTKAGLGKQRSEAQIVLDGTFSNYAKAKQKVEQALASGRTVEIYHVHRDVRKAVVGMINRAVVDKKWRTVPVATMIGDHVLAQQTTLRLAKEFAGNQRVSIVLVDNNVDGKPAKIAEMSLLERENYVTVDPQGGNDATATANRLLAEVTPEARRLAANPDVAIGAGLVGDAEVSDGRPDDRGGDRPGVAAGDGRGLPDGAEAGDGAGVEPALSRRIGRPDLANPGTTGPARQLVDEVDEARNQAGEPASRMDDAVEDEAQRRYSADPDGERRRIIAKFQKGEFITDVETRIAHHLINRDGLRAVINRTPDEMIAATKLIAMYRANGSEMARAFRSRRDRMATPTERKNMMVQAILTPPASTLEEVRQKYEAGKPDEAETIMRQHAQDAQKVLDVLKGQGIDPQDLTLPDKLTDPVVMGRVLRAISSLRKHKIGDVLLEYWINAILSGPKTQIVNIAGNTFSTAWDMTVQRWAEIAVGSLTQAEGKARAGELIPMYKAMFTTLPRAFKNSVRSFQAEQDVFEWEVSGIPVAGTPGTSKLEDDHNAIGGVKGRIIRIPGRLLKSADSFWKTLIGHSQAAAEAYRAGVDQKKSGKDLDVFMATELADFSSGSWHRALGYAQELTFQKKTDSKLLSGARFIRNLDFGHGIKPFAFVVPFTGTPWNIFATGLRKSPLGALALATRLGREGYQRAFNKGGSDPYTGREAVRHSAEQIIAWAVMMALWGMVDDDDEGRPLITGTGTPIAGNRGQREFEQRGMPPLSIRIGDTWVSYGRIEPASVAMGMTVDLIKYIKENDTVEASVPARVMNMLARQVENKTFLSGVSDLVNAVEDPDRFGTRYTANFAASWMPNLIRQPLREAQDYVPGRALAENTDESGVALWLRQVRNSAIPIESWQPAPKIDVWGRDIQRNAFQTSWLAQMAEGLTNPMARRQDTATDLDLIIKDWNDRNPEEDWWPTVPNSYFVKDKKRIDLTSDQYHAFLKARGEAAVQRLGHLTWDPKRPTEAWQMEQIQKALTVATRMAKAQVLRDGTINLDGEQTRR